MKVLDIWYAKHRRSSSCTPRSATRMPASGAKLDKARERSVAEYDFPKLAAMTGANPKIKDNPPLIYHPPEEAVQDLLIPRPRRPLPSIASQSRRIARAARSYDFKDVAIKVVGVGSVGTMCAVILMMAGAEDPLFLQVKKRALRCWNRTPARACCQSWPAGGQWHPAHAIGQRHLSRLDPGSAAPLLRPPASRHEDRPEGRTVHPFGHGASTRRPAAWSAGAAHARSGEPAQISGYLGKSDTFEEAVADFCRAYADQTERDYEVLMKAGRAGRLGGGHGAGLEYP